MPWNWPPHERDVTGDLNDQFARIGKALANPHRVEILDLLAQGDRSVETLAARASMSVGLTSSHLQVLRRVGLIAARRDGTRIVYRLAGDDVYRLLAAVRTVATDRIADAERAAQAFLGGPAETVTRTELLERVRSGSVVVVDLRPSEEYAAGHVAGALSIPLSDLESRLTELPLDLEVVAYCRGPFCALAPSGVALLRQAGRHARRLEDGFPEWRLAGLPVVVGPCPRERGGPRSDRWRASAPGTTGSHWCHARGYQRGAHPEGDAHTGRLDGHGAGGRLGRHVPGPRAANLGGHPVRLSGGVSGQPRHLRPHQGLPLLSREPARLMLLLPFLLQLSLGGYVASSAVILWALVGGTGRAVLLPRRARPCSGSSPSSC